MGYKLKKGLGTLIMGVSTIMSGYSIYNSFKIVL